MNIIGQYINQSLPSPAGIQTVPSPSAPPRPVSALLVGSTDGSLDV